MHHQSLSLGPPCVTQLRFYASDDELKRLFKSINGIIFPVSAGLDVAMQAGSFGWMSTETRETP